MTSSGASREGPADALADEPARGPDAAGRGRHRLDPPALRTPTVQRSLVLRSLAAARTRRLSLLAAPAGFGKTTVLAQWRARLLAEGVAAAWYTAAEADREPAAFLRMLAGAAHRAGVDLAASGVLEGSATPAGVTLDALLLALDLHPGEVVLILDDYDRVAGEEIDAVVNALLQTASENTHIVVASRRKLELAPSALLASGGARVFEAGELKMTPREVSELLDLPLASPEVEIIVEHAQGWPAIVEFYKLWRAEAQGGADQLAALAMSRPAEVADYLAEEVLAALDPELRALLAVLGLLRDIDAELVDSARERTDSAELLERLSRVVPGLVQPGAGPARPFQVHPLLLDHARLHARGDPEAERRLHRRAALWLERRHRVEEAVEQAQGTRDGAFLDALLTRLKPLHIFLHGGAAELRAILRRLSPERIEAHPRLQVMAALAHLKSGFFAEAGVLLDGVRARTDRYRRDPHGDGRQLALEGAAVELLLTAYADGAAADVEPPIAEIARLAGDDPMMWAWRENIRIVLHQERGEFAACRSAIARTRAVYDSHRLTEFAGAQLASHEMLLALGQGALRQAAELSASARELRRLPTRFGAPVLAIGRIVSALADYERRFTELSVDLARTGLDALGDADTWAEPAMAVCAPAADLAARREGPAGLARFLEEVGHAAGRTGLRSLETFLTALEVVGVARAGEAGSGADSAARLAAARARWAAGEPSSWRERDAAALALALWALAQGDTAGGAREAQALAEVGAREGRLRTQIKGLVLQSVCLDAAQADGLALATLGQALDLAQPQGFVAVFAEEGRALAPLLSRAAHASSLPAPARRHAEAVLKAFEAGARRPDALNEREAEILAHLVEGASNKLIARRLGVTDNTVKFHLKKIFTKLGVNSRKAAAAVARERA